MMAEFVSVMFRVCPSMIVNGFSLVSSWGIMPRMNTDWSFIVLGAMVSGLMAITPFNVVILLASGQLDYACEGCAADFAVDCYDVFFFADIVCEAVVES